jgi:hypothetical protein
VLSTDGLVPDVAPVDVKLPEMEFATLAYVTLPDATVAPAVVVADHVNV